MDAHPRLVRLEVILLQKAHVIGGHHRQAATSGDRDRGRDIRLVFRPPDALQLDVEAIWKQLEPEVQRTVDLALARVDDRTPHVPLSRARERDQAFQGVGRQPAAIDSRNAALLTLLVGAAHEASDVAIASRGLAQQRDPGGLLPLSGLVNEQIHADDRLDALPECLAVELDHGEQIALIRHGHRGHARRGHRLDEVGHAHHAVDQRILGVQAQMNEARGAHPFGSSGTKAEASASSSS